jgi:hypothetical protein
MYIMIQRNRAICASCFVGVLVYMYVFYSNNGSPGRIWQLLKLQRLSTI